MAKTPARSHDGSGSSNLPDPAILKRLYDRLYNRRTYKEILDHLKAHPASLHAEIAQQTSLSYNTLGYRLAEMVHLKFITFTKVRTRMRGRQPNSYTITELGQLFAKAVD